MSESTYWQSNPPYSEWPGVVELLPDQQVYYHHARWPQLSNTRRTIDLEDDLPTLLRRYWRPFIADQDLWMDEGL